MSSVSASASGGAVAVKSADRHGQKPLEWVTSLLSRFEDQLPVKAGPLSPQSRLLIEHGQSCLVNVSRHKFSMVVGGLVRMLQTANTMRTCSEQDLYESEVLILDTLDKCLSQITPKESPMRLDESTNIRLVIQEMSQFLQLPSDSKQAMMLKDRASKVLYSLSIANFPAVFSRISTKLKSLGSEANSCDSGGSECYDVELIKHMHVDKSILIKLLREVCNQRPFRKESHPSLSLSVEKAIWNWLDSYPSEFAELQHAPCDELAECCDRLFDQLEEYGTESWKRKAAVWPLQMMLLILCPKIMEEIHHFVSGAAVVSQKNMKKKLYFESVRKTLSSAVAGGGSTGNSASKQTQLLTAACMAGVKLCKAATYISVSDFLCGKTTMLHSVLTDLKALLFNTSRPLFRSTCGMCPTQDLQVMIDVFVALFRLKYDNEIFKVCLSPSIHHTTGAPFHLVLVMALYRIAVQPRLAWWPKIDLIYSRSQELRNLLSDTLNKVSQSASGMGLVSALSSGGHMPLKVTQSLQKMTGRLRERSGTSTFEDQNPALKQLLFWLIRLICTEPSLFLHGRVGLAGGGESEFHNSTSELINGLVTLMNQSTIMPDIAQEAMEALLCLHQPDNIRLWNPESALNAMHTFWCISSQLIFSVSQKLLHHQLANYPDVLRWLRQLLTCRNSYLASNDEIANYGSQEQICKQAAVKLETVCFVYLWSLDNDAVLMGMSLFRSLCEEADIRYTPDELPAEYFVHAHLASASNLQSVGRAVLQKSVNSYLRRIRNLTVGCSQAWEDTYQYWESFTKYLTADVRSRTEERFHMIHTLHRNLTQRKSVRTDHELEDIVNIWANTTGFLCALGGLCQHNAAAVGNAANVQASQISSPNLSISGSFVTLDQQRGRSSVSQPVPHITPCQEQYCPVTMFLSRLLSLLLLPPDALDPQIIRHVKELLSSELNPALYPCLFDQITIRTEKLFDSRGSVSHQHCYTEFVQHIVYIMKNLLTENASKDLDIVEREIEILASISIEPIILAICRFLRFWEFSHLNLVVKAKVCHLIEIVMQRRDHLLFRNEIRFRNKLVEYVAEWLTDNHMSNGESNETAAYIRDLDVACVNALASLLSRLPLHPEESERDVMDARSQLFQKYFTLFMNLLNNYGLRGGHLTGSGLVHPAVPGHMYNKDDTGSMVDSESGSIKGGFTPEHSISFPSGLSMHASQTVVNVNQTVSGSTVLMNNRAKQQQAEHQLEKLRCTTVKAMSNLLAANIDSGLIHAIGLGYHPDLRVRGAFLEVLTQILHEGGEFETLNETVLADRYQELCKLITMITDDGNMPMTVALANVVHMQQLDDLARILVTLFDANHLLYELTFKMFSKEVELAEAPTTLFRGNTLASKIMGFCFRIFGSSYLHTLLKDFVTKIMEAPPIKSYEVDPARLEPGDDLNEHIESVLMMVTKVFDTIVRSHERFPQQLRSICHCLYQVVNSRFPNNGLSAVETIVFLRFINPAIVSPFEHGLTDSIPPPKAKRGLMLVSKILQAIANQATFLREPSLAPFNVFIQSRMDHARQYTTYITLGSQILDDSSKSLTPIVGGSHSINFVSETQMVALHKLLWQYQEDMSHSLCATPAYTTLSRKMATLLAQIGPPAHNKPAHTSVLSSLELDNRKFEEIMDASKITDRDEFKYIQEQNMFYQRGRSKNGYPVYYYIARRFKKCDVNNSDALIYHVILTLKPHQIKHQPFELVLDLTHASTENRFKTETLQRWFHAMADSVWENLVSCYIINSNSFVRDYTSFHQRILGSLSGQRKIVFLDSVRDLNNYIDFDQQKLPSATLVLDENVKVFSNAMKLWHKDMKCDIKVGPTALQINYCDRQKVLGFSVLLNDVYYASEIEEVCLVDDNNITLTIMNESSPLSLIHTKCEQMVTAIVSIRNRYESTQPEQSNLHAKIRAKDVPGTLLNMALLNLGSSEPRLRTCAYNLLCALSQSFDFKLGDSLLETEGILIPPNNTAFICTVSEQLATNEPHLTLELLNECIQGFRQSNEEMKHLCLEYIGTWLNNLPRFLKQSDDQKKLKVVGIIEKLIGLTIEENEMYPLIQSKIWGNIGKVPELLDLVINGFIRRSSAGGFGSQQAELMADTTVALAAANVQAVASIVVNRLISVLDKSGSNADVKLEENAHWDDIAILARYLLFLSFNNCLDVITHLPYLLHLITLLMHNGPLCLRASIHGLTLNIIHSLCTCTHPTFSARTKCTLRLALTEFSLAKFYRLFGVDCLTGKTAAAAVFKQPLGARMSFSAYDYGKLDKSAAVADSAASLTTAPAMQDWTESTIEELHLTDLQTVTDSLIEIIDACQNDLTSTNRALRMEWTRIARSFAVRYNPALQPRALVVYSCLAKSAIDIDCQQLLMLIVQAIKRREESQLISALLMALTRLHPLLPPSSQVHKLLFWLSLIMFQLEDAQLYEHALGLLEGVLETLEGFGTFDYDRMDKVLMDVRRPLEWEFKALDQQVGLSFVHHFHFALVGYLLKGLRHPAQAIRNKTARVLNIALNIVARPTKRSRFEVASDSLPYLLALLPVSEDVRRRCHLNADTARALSMSGGSTETLTNAVRAMSHAGASDNTLCQATQAGSSCSLTTSACDSLNQTDNAQQKAKPKFKPSLTLELLNSAGTQPNPPSTSSMGVQMPRVSEVKPFLSSNRNVTRASLRRDTPAGKYAASTASDDANKNKPLSAVTRPHQLVSQRSQSLPLTVGDSSLQPPASDVQTQTSPGRPDLTSAGQTVGQAVVGQATVHLGSDEEPMTPKISVISDQGAHVAEFFADDRDDWNMVKADAQLRRKNRKSGNRNDRASVMENNVLLDAHVLAGQDMQALALTVLATLVRNSNDEKETKILFEYLAEASFLFPKVFPVVHCLLDHRITHVLQLSHDPTLLRAVLHIVQNMVPGRGIDMGMSGSTLDGGDSASQQQRQHITFLQTYGFGGLWRFAGPFLSKSASQQAMTAELCACMERLVGTLGDLPPLTPPPPSPRLPASPVFTDFPPIHE